MLSTGLAACSVQRAETNEFQQALPEQGSADVDGVSAVTAGC
jgi:hypothetical protein